MSSDQSPSSTQPSSKPQASAAPFSMGFPGVTPRKGEVVYIDGKKFILDENGKPCRMCTSLSDFSQFTNAATQKSGTKKSFAGAAAATATGAAAVAAKESSTESSMPESYRDCPPDSEELGRSTWTFLHSVAATYPEKPTKQEQAQMSTFLQIFGNIYPCWYCAEDFRKWISNPENTPKLESQDDFGKWLCGAHNNVNEKLGKEKFDCSLWKKRWIEGWNKKDGSC